MKVRMRFSKAGTMKFIGHLDVMRYFQKAFRRAGLDMIYSQGYHPHPLLSFASPLGVGLTSDGEYLDLQLSSAGSSGEMLARINAAMAPELRVESFRRLPDDSKASMAMVAAADYLVSRKDGYGLACGGQAEFAMQFADYLAQPSICLEKKTKSGMAETDIRPLIIGFGESAGALAEVLAGRGSVAEAYANGQRIFLRLSAGSAANLKPELVMEGFCRFIGEEYHPFAWQSHRLELYAAGEQEGVLVPLDAFGEDMV